MNVMNFLACPNCKQIQKDRDSDAQKELDALYGQIPQEEWAAKRDEVMNRESASLKPSLREQYDLFGADAGKLTLNYRCNCSVCGMSYSYSVEQDIPLPGVISPLPGADMKPGPETLPNE